MTLLPKLPQLPLAAKTANGTKALPTAIYFSMAVAAVQRFPAGAELTECHRENLVILQRVTHLET